AYTLSAHSHIPPSHTLSLHDALPIWASGILPVPREHEVPASVAQERLWKLQHMLPGVPLFNILYALRLTSTLDVAILERSLDERSEEHTSELQSRGHLVWRLRLDTKK